MNCLCRSDANQDAQHFHACRPLGHRGIKAVAALLDCWEMESGGIRNRLQEIRIGCIAVGPRNRPMLPNSKARDRRRKRVPKIGILTVTAITSPPTPTRIQRELGQVCEPWFPAGSSGSASWESAELLQVNGIGAVRD